MVGCFLQSGKDELKQFIKMRIHFIGIGGIGVSALAQYYLSRGHKISGSDLVASEITDFLAEKRVKIFIGNSAENIKKDIDLVIHSPAVKKNNPELAKARELKIKMQSYPEALGELTKQYFTIAVSGAHGKSTTTALIGLVLAKGGLDPTVIVGTKLKEFGGPAPSEVEGSNFRYGKSKYLVIEACEYDSSFSHYSPQIAVVLNLDKEHMDYFKTFGNVVREFRSFIMRLPKGGFLVANKDDKNMPKFFNPKFSVVNYSLKQKEAVKIKKILKIPGRHNVSNALAVLAVARILGIPDKISFKAISEYGGAWRRFEIFQRKLTTLNNPNPIHYTLISDYGHHPNEVAATLKAAREKYPKNPSTALMARKIWCIFQPHQYQRTHYLFNDFVIVFRKAPIDEIIITDIYDVAGREEKKISSGVSSKKLVEKIAKKGVEYLPLNEAESFVKKNIQNGDVLIIMGAGDIYKLAEKF